MEPTLGIHELVVRQIQNNLRNNWREWYNTINDKENLLTIKRKLLQWQFTVAISGRIPRVFRSGHKKQRSARMPPHHMINAHCDTPAHCGLSSLLRVCNEVKKVILASIVAMMEMITIIWKFCFETIVLFQILPVYKSNCRNNQFY